MNIQGFLNTLKAQDVKITVNDGNLKVNAPSGVINSTIKKQLKNYKQEIIDLLTIKNKTYLPLEIFNKKSIIPLSLSQQRLWFLSQLDNESHTNYNMFSAFNMEGYINLPVLTATFKNIIHRHDIMRTTFVTNAGTTSQVITDKLLLNIPIIDIPSSSINKFIQNEIKHVFDLSQGPIFNIKILRITPTKHILLLNMHHIISDGWSFNILVKEMLTVYTALFYDKKPPLLKPQLQYSDFSLWQQEWLKSTALLDQITYWKKTLLDAPELLELRTDKPRALVNKNNGRQISLSLSTGLTAQLRKFCLNNDSTLFMVLLSVFAVCLSRYSNQNDICIGTPIANRQHPSLEKALGFFVNTLILRIKIDSNFTFIELVQEVKKIALSAYENQDVPFERIVEEINPKRSLSYTPLFQVMFSLMNSKMEKFELPCLKIAPIDIKSSTTRFDLSIDLIDDESIYGFVQYNSDLFSQTTIDRIINYYQSLIEQLVVTPNTLLKNISSISPKEYQRIVKHWNNTESKSNSLMCVHYNFEKQVQTTPNALVKTCDQHAITYNKLNENSNKYANFLIKQGIKPEISVAVCIDNSIELLTVLLAILKAGGAFVPINSNIPEQQIDYILTDSQCQLLVIQEDLNTTLFQNVSLPIHIINKNWFNTSVYSCKNIKHRATLQNIIYINYTSGSTGHPKGVMVTHISFSNYLKWIQQTFRFNQCDSILFKTPLNFDVANWEWAIPLITEAQLIIAKKESQCDLQKLLYLIERYEISTLQVVPSLLNHLLHHHDVSKMQSLTHLFCIGEPLSARLCNLFKKQNLKTYLYNIYGPTETTINSTYWIYNNREHTSNIPIGTPIDNSQIYILDSDLNPVPIGVKGEIFIAGAGLARGYTNHPSLTAKVFIPNKFSNNLGERMYQTGDFAYYLSNGTIEYIGREDQQVKIRGMRVELGEIDNILLTHNVIREAVVFSYLDKFNNDSVHLVAYIIINKHHYTNKVSLHNDLLAILPEHMIPNSFIILDSLPLLSNGKINRKRLFNDIHTHLQKNSYTPPNTELEKTLTNIWSDSLKIPISSISTTDNFFDLGGHSLLANLLINKIRNSLNLSITIRHLFTYPTISQLALFIELNGAYLKPYSKLQQQPIINRNNPMPLSCAQQQIWNSYQDTNTNPSTFNLPSALKLQGRLNTKALICAYQQLIQRHDILRTLFYTVNNTVFQSVTNNINTHVDILEISKQKLPATLTKLSQYSFDLSKGPLIKLTLLKLSELEYIFFLNIHHIIVDRNSLTILYRELAYIYTNIIRKHQSSLPYPTMHYADYINWQQNEKCSAERQNNVYYWKSILKGARIGCCLPTKTTLNIVNPDPHFAVCNISFPVKLRQQLYHFCHSHNITLFVLLITGFNLLLARESKQHDISILFDELNRQHHEFDDVVGLFSKTLILRTTLHNSLSFIDIIKQVQTTLLSAIEHQNISFSNLLKSVDKHANDPLSGIAFELQQQVDHAFQLPDISVNTHKIAAKFSQVDLGMSIVESENTLCGEIIYNADLFDESVINDLSSHYVELLNHFIQNIDIKNCIEIQVQSLEA